MSSVRRCGISPSCAPSTITRSHSRPFTRWTVESVTCPARARIVADRHALEVLAQPRLERRRIGVHRRDRDERGQVVEVRRVAARGPSCRACPSRRRGRRRRGPSAAPSPRRRRATCAASRSRSSANSWMRSVSAEPSVSAWARSDADVQPPVADRVDDLRGDAPVRPAHDLGEVGAAQLAAVGDRARDAEVRERAAHAGAAQEVLADRGGDREPAVVREHLHREQPGVDAARAPRSDSGSAPGASSHDSIRSAACGREILGRPAVRPAARRRGRVARLAAGAHHLRRPGAGCARAACARRRRRPGGQR